MLKFLFTIVFLYFYCFLKRNYVLYAFEYENCNIKHENFKRSIKQQLKQSVYYISKRGGMEINEKIAKKYSGLVPDIDICDIFFEKDNMKGFMKVFGFFISLFVLMQAVLAIELPHLEAAKGGAGSAAGGKGAGKGKAAGNAGGGLNVGGGAGAAGSGVGNGAGGSGLGSGLGSK